MPRPRIAAMPSAGLRDRARRRRRRRAAGRRPTTATRARTRSANVAQAVGGLDLPNMEALGLGNVEPLEGCPPQPGAPAVAGRLVERSKGKDTTTGHWELMGIVTAQAVPDLPARLPARRDRPVHAPHGRAACSATSRRRGRRSSRSSARSIRRPGSGSSTRRPTRSSRSPRTKRPCRSTSSTRRAAIAREILTGKHAVGRVIARPFTGDARQLRAHAEPARLLARAAPAELPLARPRRGHEGARRRQDRRHLRGLRHRRVASDEVEHRGHPADREAAAGARRRASSSPTSSRPTCSGATATTR